MTTSEEDKAKAKALRREYMRRWRAEHPDQAKKHRENYWLKRARKAIEEEAAAEKGRKND